jgi:hypothetical protein
MNNCRGFGQITVPDNASLTANGSSFATSSFTGNYFISGTGVVYLQNCHFGSCNDTGKYVLQSTLGTVTTQSAISSVVNCTVGDVNSTFITNYLRLYETGLVYNVLGCGLAQQGSILKSVNVSTDYSLQMGDHYIGVDTSGGAITINLPDGTSSVNANQDQSFIIKDVSGDAGTNPITITTVGGTVTIDGATSKLINVAYGALTIKFDGTNYFLISADLSLYSEGVWTPTLDGTTPGTTTYSSQNGYYSRVGNLVTVIGSVNYTAATGTGNMEIGGLPFTIRNQTQGTVIGSILISSAGTAWPAGTTFSSLYGMINTTTCSIYCSGTLSAGGFMQMANTDGGVSFTLTYQV